jgi:hypothetical protein
VAGQKSIQFRIMKSTKLQKLMAMYERFGADMESITWITPGFAALSPAYAIVFLAWRDLACKITAWIN